MKVKRPPCRLCSILDRYEIPFLSELFQLLSFFFSRLAGFDLIFIMSSLFYECGDWGMPERFISMGCYVAYNKKLQ